MHSEEIHSIMRDLRISEDAPPAATMAEAVFRLEGLAESVSVGGLLFRPRKLGGMRINIATRQDRKLNRLRHIEQAIYEGRFPA